MTLNEKYLTIDALCDLLTVSPKTVASWRHRGVDQASIKKIKKNRYKRSDIDAWIEQNKCTPKDQRDEYLRDWEMYGEEIKEQQNAE